MLISPKNTFITHITPTSQIKQLAEDNTDLSIQALYKQKELREIRDKIRKRRIDVNASTKDLQTITRGLVSLDKVRESKVKGKFTPKQWQEYDTCVAFYLILKLSLTHPQYH